MGYALLFSGQGTQHTEMLPWLDSASAAQPLLASLQESLGSDWRRSLADSSLRSSNAVAQPLVTGTALAAWAVLAARLKTRPLVVAGYSVGELAAFSAAGALGPGDALRLARSRASAMDAAVAGVDTGLLAISAVNEAEVLAACPGLECAIRIAPDNNVFGGARDALAQARRTLGLRAQFKSICVTLASHTSWMRSASEAFARDLQGIVLQMPSCPIATNAAGATTRNAAALASALALQIRQTVQWGACMAAIAERQPSCVLEIGGGRALARMWSARYPGIPARSVDEFRGPDGAAAWIERQA